MAFERPDGEGRAGPELPKQTPMPSLATLPTDPWAHRAAGMQCSTCMWYAPKQVVVAVDRTHKAIGRCRRHAPSMSGYPVVYPTDWCGDHRVDETKI